MSRQFLKMKQKLKFEVSTAFEIWKEVLLDEFGNNLNYVYSKGSAVKDWDQMIDYVPMVSDIDIHFTLQDYKHDNNLPEAVASALQVGSQYETKFKERLPRHHHIPRPQVMCINSFMGSENWVNPAEFEVTMLYGKFPKYKYLSNTAIKNIDFNNLMEIESILTKLYWTSIDRVGYELWSLMRLLTWRVGPIPTRILTQVLNENPYEIWSWNRSILVEKLQSVNMDKLANAYHKFYREGWVLFLSNFSNTASYHTMITAATEVLDLGYHWAVDNKN